MERTLTARNLPGLLAGDAAWRGDPPDPLVHPALYDGVIWRRVLAYVVDLGMLLLCAAIIWFGLGLIAVLSLGLLAPLLPVALALLPVGYHGLLVGGRRSATIGMRIMGLEVRSWTGQRPTVPQALLMAILFYATLMVTGSLILLVALFSSRGRTVHDMLSGTVVVRCAASGPLAP